MSGFRVIVTGSRNFDDFDLMFNSLKNVSELYKPAKVTIVHGGAKGADDLAERVANRLDLPTEVHYADWKRHGRGAEPIRNTEMVKAGADMVLAFPLGVASRGTEHCMRTAKRDGITVVNVTGGGE